MIKINVTKRKIVEFDVNVKGVDPNALSGRLSLFYENVIYSFPAIVEDGNVVRVEIPALDEVIKGEIPDKYQAALKLEMVGADTFMLPWGGTAHLEHPVKVEAVMRSGGQRLEEEKTPKVEAKIKMLKEDPKYDIKTLASGTSNKKSGDEEKEKEKLKKDKEKEKKEKSKLAKKLGGEEEKEKKPTEEASKLGEKLAMALLGEEEFQSDKIDKKISKDEWKKQFIGQLEMIKPKVAEKLKKKNIIGFMTKAMKNGLSPGQAVDKAK